MSTLTPGELQTLQWAGLDKIFGAQYGVPVSTLLGQQYIESRGNPTLTNKETVTLPNGQTVQTDAQGLAQFEPQTWAAEGTGSPYNPVDAVNAEAKYLSQLDKQTGSMNAALEAYAGGAYPNYPSQVDNAGSILSAALGSSTGGVSEGGSGSSGPTTITTPYKESTTPPSSGTSSASSGSGFFGWLHTYAWVLIIPGAAVIWLGIKKIVG